MFIQTFYHWIYKNHNFLSGLFVFVCIASTNFLWWVSFFDRFSDSFKWFFLFIYLFIYLFILIIYKSLYRMVASVYKYL